ncbi:MAG: outer membrane beta-barrel protein [Bacteroidota bacterium]
MRVLLLGQLLFLSFLLSGQESRKGAVYFNGLSGVTGYGATTAPLNPFSEEAEDMRVGYFFSDRIVAGGNPLEVVLWGRYYQPLGTAGKLRAFAELGINVEDFEILTINWEPAVGLEYEVRPGILASVALRRTLGDVDLNFTSLLLGFDAYTRFGNDLRKRANYLDRGTFLLNPGVGRLDFRGAGERGLPFTSTQLHVGAAFLFTERLAIEANLAHRHSEVNSAANDFNQTDREFFASIGARVFPTGGGRLRPYLGGGAVFTDRNADVTLIGGANRQQVDEGYVSPYAKVGVLYQLDNYLALDGGVEQLFDRITPFEQNEIRLSLGLKLTLARGE